MLCSLYEGQWKRKNTVHNEGSIYYVVKNKGFRRRKSKSHKHMSISNMASKYWLNYIDRLSIDSL